MKAIVRGGCGSLSILMDIEKKQDKDDAEAVMGLAGLSFSNQWDKYWKLGQKAA